MTVTPYWLTIVWLCVWDRESDLHREAKYLFEYELEKPGGIPSVQALLILGDLECGVGRDNTGWMIGGIQFCILSSTISRAFTSAR
jgi:hypothetical protein